MNMRDAENGKMMWEKNKWPDNWREEEVEAGRGWVVFLNTLLCSPNKHN